MLKLSNVEVILEQRFFIQAQVKKKKKLSGTSNSKADGKMAPNKPFLFLQLGKRYERREGMNANSN